MGNPCAQERGLEEGLSRLGQCPAERLRTQRGKVDCETNPAAVWHPMSFWSAVEPQSRTEGKRPPSRTQGHVPPPLPLGLQCWLPGRLGPTPRGRRRRDTGAWVNTRRASNKRSCPGARDGDAAGARAAEWAERSGAPHLSEGRTPQLRRAGTDKGGARRGLGAQAAGFD